MFGYVYTQILCSNSVILDRKSIITAFLRIFTHSHHEIINFSEKLGMLNKYEGFSVIFINDELNYLMVRLRNQHQDLLIRYPGAGKQNTVKGILGEKFVRYSISHGLWKLGYCLDPTPHPRSYSLELKYGCNGTGHGGMDLLLKMVDGRGATHRVLIEVKNWKHYRYITPETFRTKILERFQRVDALHEYPWALAMNIRNKSLINSRCLWYHIHILPMAHHVTPESVCNDDILRELFCSFIDAFCTFITTAVPEDAFPYLVVENQGKDRTMGIIQDLFLGVSYDIISLRYDVSGDYVMRLASNIRGLGIYLPDRRDEDWVVQRVIQE
jgi:hypothetical protein